MRPILLALCVMMAPGVALAQDVAALTRHAVTDHVLPRFDTLAAQSEALAQAAASDCDATSPTLRAAYGTAFDAWIAASHLRFGPTEVQDRAYALAFWPDSRGATPRTLSSLIRAEDPVAQSAERYAEVSIAARGFYALDSLLYDDDITDLGSADYRCQLIRTVTADIAALTQQIDRDWQDDYADRLMNPGAGGTYRSELEAAQELFKALTTGLEFTADTRLGRPLGTFDKPRPLRAEARRSGRSLRHVALSLTSLQDLAVDLAGSDTALVDDLNSAFDFAQGRIDALDDPILAGVATPQGRLRVEVIQQAVASIRDIVRNRLGPKLGGAAGFNALDGD